MRFLTSYIAIFFLFISWNLIADEQIVDCNGSDWNYGKLGELEVFELKDELSFENMLKEILLDVSAEIDLLARTETNPSGLDRDYITVTIELLEAKPQKHLSCLWSNFQEGDVLRRFIEKGPNEKRWGYILLRNGVFLAYFYNEIAIV